MPAFRRNDVTREADLDRGGRADLGAREAPRHAALAPRRERPAGARAAAAPPASRTRWSAPGVYEAVGWSFAAPDLAERLRLPAGDPRHAAVPLRNPMSEEQSVLRTTLLGSLLDAARVNRSRGIADVRLFEAGAVYFDRARPGEPRGTLPDERQHLAALLTGPVRPPTWREPEPPRADFFAAKAVLEALLHAMRVPWAVEPAPSRSCTPAAPRAC